MPDKSVKVNILENSYDITYPNVGEEMSIDLLKIRITDGRYEVLKYSMDARFQRQCLIVDAMATFNTLAPAIKNDLKVASMLDLTSEQMDVVVEAYERDFLPWYEEWQVLFLESKTKEEEKKKADTLESK